MNRFKQWLRQALSKGPLGVLDAVLPHAAIVLSGMLIVFFLIDRVNKPMAFMTNEFHKRITFLLSLMAVYLAIRRIAQLRRQEREAAAPRRRTAPDERPRPERRAGSDGYTRSHAYDDGYTASRPSSRSYADDGYPSGRASSRSYADDGYPSGRASSRSYADDGDYASDRGRSSGSRSYGSSRPSSRSYADDGYGPGRAAPRRDASRGDSRWQ